MAYIEKMRGLASQVQDNEIVFQKPIGGSVFLLLLSLFFLLVPVLWGFLIAHGKRTGLPFETLVIWAGQIVLGGFAFALAGFYFLMSFPSKTHVNTKQRTFKRVTRRWLWGAFVLEGSLEEVSGICVTSQGNVLLALKKQRGLLYGLEMGQAGSRERGATLAGCLSLQLGLPVIKVPW